MTVAAKRALAKFVKRSICECGFPVLAVDVPVGRTYTIRPEDTRELEMICGGCATRIRRTWVYVEGYGPGHQSGYLPVEIFEIDEGLL